MAKGREAQQTLHSEKGRGHCCRCGLAATVVKGLVRLAQRLSARLDGDGTENGPKGEAARGAARRDGGVVSVYRSIRSSFPGAVRSPTPRRQKKTRRSRLLGTGARCAGVGTGEGGQFQRARLLGERRRGGTALPSGVAVDGRAM